MSASRLNTEQLGRAFASSADAPASRSAVRRRRIVILVWCTTVALAIGAVIGLSVWQGVQEKKKLRNLDFPLQSVQLDGFISNPSGDLQMIKMNNVLMAGAVASAASLGMCADASAQSSAVQWTTASGGNGHWYKLSLETVGSWDDARINASNAGGHLATLNSQPEAEFVRQIGWLQNIYGGYVGLQKLPSTGWHWITGEPLVDLGPYSLVESGDGTCSNFADLQQGSTTPPVVNDIGCNWWQGPYFVEWSADCNADGIVDYGQILSGQLIDANSNGIPDCCEQGLTCSPTLLHHFEFNGNLTDSVGGATGHLMNGCHIADGVLVSDGIDDLVDFDQYLIPATGSVSVAMWVHSGSGQAIHEYISQGAFGSAFYIGRDHSDVFRIGDQWQGTGVPYAPYCDVWRHMAVVIDRIRNVTEFWIDASLVASNGIAVQITSDASGQPTGIKTRLATQYCSAPCVFCCSAENFRGSMDDLRIYEGALSGAMLAEIVANSEFRCLGDISGNHSVDGVDLAALLGTWGTIGQGEFDCDIDNDGIVGGPDLTIILGGWGPCPN